MSHPMRPRVSLVVVEYTHKDRRATKTFYNDRKAKAFFRKMIADGRNPKIINARLN